MCISGGKDSMLLAKLMQELHRHSDVPFELAFLVMDPGYNEANRRKIESNAALLHVPVTVFETNVFAVTLDTFPGWKTGGEVHSFLEGYSSQDRTR